MKRKKSKLELLTKSQIEAITEKAEGRSDIPVVTSKQVNMRLSADLIARIKLLAEAQGLPFTTFLSRLLQEDIERLWKVYKKAD